MRNILRFLVCFLPALLVAGYAALCVTYGLMYGAQQ